MAKCPKCNSRKGKRFCPALSAEICSLCCGEHRLRTIPCPPDCAYLEGESYQTRKRGSHAAAKGRRFIDGLGGRFKNGDEFDFALLLHADLYFFASVHGVVDNAGIIRALEGLRGKYSRIHIPGTDSDPLSAYLKGRVEQSPRYASSPAFDDKGRRNVTEELARHIRYVADDSSETTYFQELATFFGEVDLQRDFGFRDEDAQAVHGGADDGGPAPRRSSGGLILPT